MDDGSILSCIIILALLALAAYFAVCETAFASVSRVKLKTALERGDARAEKALYVADRFDKAITTILIGTNIVHIAAASYVTVLVTRRWGVSAVTLSTILTTVAVFLFGEMLPKSIGKKYSEHLSLSTAGSLGVIMKLLSPLSAVLTAIGNAAAHLSAGEAEVSVTEDELYDIIDTMTDDGELDEQQGELVQSALSFGDVTAEHILTARVDMASIDVNASCEDILSYIREQRHSRLPVYEGTVDNIVGILQIRKYIKAYLTDREHLDIRPLLDKAYFVHQSTYIDELLPYMSSKKINMVVVSDSYGGTLGIVTVEDILEELVGEIWDEDDEVVETRVKSPDGTFAFAASVPVEDAFAFMDYEDPTDFDFGHKLMGEWAYEQFELIPEQGEHFDYNGLRITVTQVQDRRIMKLKVQRLPASLEAKKGGEEK